MKFIIREMKEQEYPLLEKFLYEAIFQEDNKKPLPHSIINNPTLQVYIQNFGQKKADHCLCAVVDNIIVGAVWVRIINGFGQLDNKTPEFAISLFKDYRGYGIGSALMKQMLILLENKKYQKASLSVQKDNYAWQMYLKIGFKIIDETEEEYIMLYEL